MDPCGSTQPTSKTALGYDPEPVLSLSRLQNVHIFSKAILKLKNSVFWDIPRVVRWNSTDGEAYALNLKVEE
jgi:hypothetical protein